MELDLLMPNTRQGLPGDHITAPGLGDFHDYFQIMAWYKYVYVLAKGALFKVLRYQWSVSSHPFGGKTVSMNNQTRVTTVWRLYFAGLNFRELLFENISLKKFREFAVKRHAHTMGVVYYTRT